VYSKISEANCLVGYIGDPKLFCWLDGSFHGSQIYAWKIVVIL